MGSRQSNPTNHSYERSNEKFEKSYISDVDILKTRKFGIRALALIKTENEKCSQKREINLPPETYTDCIMSTSTVASKSAYAPLWRPHVLLLLAERYPLFEMFQNITFKKS